MKSKEQHYPKGPARARNKTKSWTKIEIEIIELKITQNGTSYDEKILSKSSRGLGTEMRTNNEKKQDERKWELVAVKDSQTLQQLFLPDVPYVRFLADTLKMLSLTRSLCPSGVFPPFSALFEREAVSKRMEKKKRKASKGK